MQSEKLPERNDLGNENLSSEWDQLSETTYCEQDTKNNAESANTIDDTEQLSQFDERMMTSKNSAVRMIVRMLGQEKMEEISKYVDAHSETLQNNPEAIKAYEGITLASLDQEQKDNLRFYTGREYKYINALQRGYWKYEELGPKTEEVEKTAIETSNAIHKIIENVPEVPTDFTVYRGTNFENFRGYGIDSQEDLSKLEGQLFYESGFTSTSLEEESSFVDKNLGDGLKQNDIKVEIIVPKQSKDGIMLTSEQVTYQPEEKEYLLDRSSLFKINSVSKDEKGHTLIKMTLIPKDMYDRPQ